MGMRHAENLHRHVAVVHVAAAYDLDRSRAEQVAALCGAAVYDDPLRLIQDDRVEAIIIASPDATHAGFVQECLRGGKPVLCEKPLATSAADAARVIEAECAVGRRLVSVGLMRRFDPYHVAVQQVAAVVDAWPSHPVQGIASQCGDPRRRAGRGDLTNWPATTLTPCAGFWDRRSQRCTYAACAHTPPSAWTPPICCSCR